MLKTFCRIIILILFLNLINVSFVNAAIVINEIMYNPSSNMGDDSDLEWIEIYNNGTSAINLNNWKINNKNFDDIDISANEYIVVARELIDGSDADSDSFESYYGNNNSVWDYLDDDYSAVDGSFALGNTADTINLTNNSYTYIVNYIDDWGGDGNGKSLEYVNGSWLESLETGGTPGRKNTAFVNKTKQIDSGLRLSIPQQDTLYLGAKYKLPIKIENLNYTTGQDYINVTIHYNISKDNSIISAGYLTARLKQSKTFKIDFSPNDISNFIICGKITDSTITDIYPEDDFECKSLSVIDTSAVPCDITLNFTLDNLIYLSNTTISFDFNVNNKTFPYSIGYWIEDLFENIIQSKKNATKYDKGSVYKTTRNKVIGAGVFLIKSNLTALCSDINKTNNYAEELIIVKGQQGSSQQTISDSYIKILDLKDEAKFGDTVDVKVDIYKGNTNKYSISLWIEGKGKKVSEITKIRLYKKFTDYSGTFPVQIKPNCNHNFKNGKYTVFIEGLDVSDSKKIDIKGITSSLCKTEAIESSSKKSSKKFEYEIIEIPKKISDEIKTKVELSNNDAQDYNIKLWSYVYRGNKCYSGKRDENKIEVALPAHSERDVKLYNTVSDAEPGNYKYKIVINKDNQKTNEEIIKEIEITGKAIDNSKNKITANAIHELKAPLGIVYESTSEKMKKMTFYLLIALSVFLNILLIWKR